jgi:hypothetical protein
MKGLTFIFLFIIFAHFSDVSKEKETDRAQFINAGRVVNKLGEISPSIENLLAEYYKNNQVRGQDFTNNLGEFSIEATITQIDGMRYAGNYIVMTGANPYSEKTGFRLNLNEPGILIEPNSKGQPKILQLKPGSYEFTYNGTAVCLKTFVNHYILG